MKNAIIEHQKICLTLQTLWLISVFCTHIIVVCIC